MPRNPNDNEVTVTVTGPEGAVTAVMHKLAELLLDQTDVPVQWADPKRAAEAHEEVCGDWDNDLNFYKPTVVLAEEVDE